ncbi:MAG TPA: FAD-binding oxidoreductase, partial [Actinospica sp.]|nr:FAD-binding oxidoreductase [Actinospica sp.]
MSQAVVPRSFSEAAAALAAAADRAEPVRIIGGGSKLGWGGRPPSRAVQLQTTHLSRVTLHDDGRSATVGAGTPLVRAQAIFARAGRMLAIDPQLGLGRTPTATVGGVLATADSGPLSHRYGPPRRQLLGLTAALSDGRLLRTGPRTDHEQHGWDVVSLFTGSFGTLGVLLAVDVRLHPLPRATASALGTSGEPERLRDAAERLGDEHPDLEALDFAWHGGRGGLLAQAAGEDAEARAQRAALTMRACGLEDTGVRADDAGVWARQRAGQRSTDSSVLRVRHPPERLAAILRVADTAEAVAVGRAALGTA